MNELFAPGPIWKGETAVVVAGGPSLSLKQVREIGIARANDRCRVIAVSDAVYPCWFADILYSADAKWWDHHIGVPTFKGQKVSRNRLGRYDVDHLRGIDCNGKANPFHYVEGVDGYDATPGMLRYGPNSGHHAVHLAAQLGASRIITAAMDFTDKDFARDHWFGRHQDDMDMCSETSVWRAKFHFLTDELAKIGITVLNASLSSTIKWLPTVRLESAF